VMDIQQRTLSDEEREASDVSHKVYERARVEVVRI
jgi:hypothetical protein